MILRLPAKKSSRKLRVCCIPSAPVLTLGRDVGWGRKRVVRPAVSTASGWHPPRAISHAWHTPGKGLCILLCPDSHAHVSSPRGAVLVCRRPIFWEVRLKCPSTLPCLSAPQSSWQGHYPALSKVCSFRVVFLKSHGGFSGTGR